MADDNSIETPQENANGTDSGQGQAAGDDWAEEMREQAETAKNAEPAPAGFEDLEDAGQERGSAANLDFLLDIPLEVTVELGRTSMLINDVLQLNQGSVVELEKSAGEPVEIMVNDKLLGKGEVIVVNDRFGVRITEIISQADRIKNMG